MSRRTRTLSAALLAVLCCLLAAPLAALGQGSPFETLPQGTPDQTTTTSTPTVTTSSTDSGLETWQGVLIVIGGVALIGGIGMAITRDARAHAPVDEAEAEMHRADAHQQARAAKARQRQKAKAARAARRRNR